MRIAILLPCIAAVGLSTTAALADTRYGCMADSPSVKLGIHVEFSDELGGRLSHLSGQVTPSGADVPASVKQISLRGEMVSQAWTGSGKLLMRFFDEHADGAPVYLSLAAVAQGGDATRMHGTYMIDQAQEKGPSFHQEGALFCQLDAIKPAASSY